MTQAHSMVRVMRFLSAGGTGVLLYYLILFTLTDLFGVWYMVSATTASAVNWTTNFLFQKFWTFQNTSREHIHRQAGTYVLMATGLSIANLLFLYALVQHLRLWYLGAQVIVTVPLTIASYFITRQIFRKEEP